MTSPRLGFSVWSPDDFSLSLTLWGNAEVTRLIGGPFTDAQVRERLARNIETQRTLKIQYWPLFLLENGGFVGCCGLRPHKQETRVFEFGFHLLPTYWHLGLAQEAARAVIAYAFNSLGAESLFAGHHPENFASRRALEKLGFVFTGRELYSATGLLHLCYSLAAPPYRLK